MFTPKTKMTDMKSHKTLTKAGAGHAIDVLEEFYTNYGTPDVNRTDNGPPLNSALF